jgi:spermidine dehydrogenase
LINRPRLQRIVAPRFFQIRSKSLAGVARDSARPSAGAVANSFQGRTKDYFGIDADLGRRCEEGLVSGFAGPGLPGDSDPDEPFIYHSPEGNASLAWLLVCDLIPSAAPGVTIEDIVLAPFDYERLDAAGSTVRFRLGSARTHVANVTAAWHSATCASASSIALLRA